jgi:hypothetical protein
MWKGTLHKQVSIGLSAFVLALTQCSSGQTASPLWTLELKGSGYPPAESWRDTHLSLKSSSEGIAFIDDGTVVAYFVTKADVTELSNRNDPKLGSPFRLRAVLGDISGRKIGSTRDWPTREFQSWLVPIADGKIIVRAGNSLQLYSSEFTMLKEKPLQGDGSWYTEASPSGRTIWLDNEGHGRSRIQVLEASTLDELSAWDEMLLGGWFSVSNHAIATRTPQHPERVAIRNIGDAWRVLYEAPVCVSEPRFVNDEMLIAGPCDTVSLISTGGDILMKDKIPRGAHLERDVAVSRNGKMAAVSLMRTRGGAFDTALLRSETTVVVYDVELRNVAFTAKVEPLPKSSYHFALSPDGAFLAVMTDGIEKIYETKKSSDKKK